MEFVTRNLISMCTNRVGLMHILLKTEIPNNLDCDLD